MMFTMKSPGLEATAGDNFLYSWTLIPESYSVMFDLFTLGSGGKESRNDKLLSMPRELSSFSWQGFLNNEWQLPWIVTQQKCDLLLRIAKPSPDKSPPYTRQLDLTGTGETALYTDMALWHSYERQKYICHLNPPVAKEPFFGTCKKRQHISLQQKTILHWQGHRDCMTSFVLF